MLLQTVLEGGDNCQVEDLHTEVEFFGGLSQRCVGLWAHMTDGGNEGAQHEALATQGDLQVLFLRTRGWLERNCPELIEPEDPIEGYVGPVPVVASSPRHEFTIPEPIVRRFADAAAATLNVGKALTLVYFKEHLLPRGPEEASEVPDLRPERCEFINVAPHIGVEAEHLSIDLIGDEREDDSYVSDRTVFRTASGEGSEDNTDAASRIGGHVIDLEARRRVEHGKNVMTFREYEALDEILDSLDLMREAMES